MRLCREKVSDKTAERLVVLGQAICNAYWDLADKYIDYDVFVRSLLEGEMIPLENVPFALMGIFRKFTVLSMGDGLVYEYNTKEDSVHLWISDKQLRADAKKYGLNIPRRTTNEI